MNKPFAMTDREAEIVTFGDEHPELSQREIAQHFKVCQSTISRVLATYRPDRPRRERIKLPVKPSVSQQRIIEAIMSNPDMMQKNIAAMVGCSKIRVSQTIAQYFPERYKRRRNQTGPKIKTTVDVITSGGGEMTCLGNGCNAKIPKSKYVHFCASCEAKRRAYEQWSPVYMVYVEGHGRV